MTKKARRRYSDEFKAEAVNMVLGEGYAISEAARRLDIDRNLLDRYHQRLQELVAEQPHQIRPLQARFQEETGKTVSMEPLRQALKKIAIASSAFGIH